MMTKKYLFRLSAVFLALLLTTLGLAGCMRSGEKRYALCMSHLSNDFTNTLAKAARQQADVLGIELVVLDAQQSVMRQAGQIESLIADGIAGLIIEPAASEGLDTVLQICDMRDIPVVMVSQNVSDAYLVDCFVGSDTVESGRLEMMACLESINYSGEIAILHGPVGSHAQKMRYRGYLEVIENYPSVKIIAEINADWNSDHAESIITNWLAAGKQMDAIVAQNDEMALGAISALKTAGMLSQVRVFGIDASPQAIISVRAGEMTATITQQTNKQGQEAVKACVSLVNGRDIAPEIIIEQLVVS